MKRTDNPYDRKTETHWWNWFNDLPQEVFEPECEVCQSHENTGCLHGPDRKYTLCINCIGE